MSPHTHDELMPTLAEPDEENDEASASYGASSEEDEDDGEDGGDDAEEDDDSTIIFRSDREASCLIGVFYLLYSAGPL